MTIEDKLAFARLLEQWGYLLLNTEADPGRLVKLLVVPTSLNLDFIDMVIGLKRNCGGATAFAPITSPTRLVP